MSTQIIQEKFLSLQVCSDLTDMATLTEEVNNLHECGTELGWVLTDRPELAPVPCAEHPDRRHYIFNA